MVGRRNGSLNYTQIMEIICQRLDIIIPHCCMQVFQLFEIKYIEKKIIKFGFLKDFEASLGDEQKYPGF